MEDILIKKQLVSNGVVPSTHKEANKDVQNEVTHNLNIKRPRASPSKAIGS